MSDFFSRLRDGASKNLMSKYGDTFRVTDSSSPVFDPETGTVTSTSVYQDVMGKSFSRNDNFDAGEMVRSGEVEIFLTANGMTFAPKVGMTIKSPPSNTESLEIVKVQAIPESGTAVMYKIMAVR